MFRSLRKLFWLYSGIDPQLMRDVNRLSYFVNSIYVFSYYYAVIVIWCLFFFVFQLMFNSLLSFCFASMVSFPIYFILMGFFVTSIGLKNNSLLSITTMISRISRFVLLFIFFFIVAKGIDLGILLFVKNESINSIDMMISLIIELNEKNVFVKVLTGIQIFVFISPFLLKFIITPKHSYSYFEKMHSDEIIVKKRNELRREVGRRRKSIALNYKGQKELDPTIDELQSIHFSSHASFISDFKEKDRDEKR